MEKLTHWKKLFNPNYLGAYSLDPGEEPVLTIREVKTEPVKNADGKTEDCMVCHFTTGKPMILNKTNAKTIAKVLGTPYVEQWTGKAVQLHAAKVSAFGEQVEALRVRPFKPKAGQRLTDEKFGKMLKAIEAGEWTVGQALERFTLTTEQLDTLNEFIANLETAAE